MMETHRECPICGNRISAQNWTLHQTRCGHVQQQQQRQRLRPEQPIGNSTGRRDRYSWGASCCGLNLLRVLLLAVIVLVFILLHIPLQLLPVRYWATAWFQPPFWVTAWLTYRRYVYVLWRIPHQSYPDDPWPEQRFDWMTLSQDSGWSIKYFLNNEFVIFQQPHPSCNCNCHAGLHLHGGYELDALDTHRMRYEYLQFVKVVEELEWVAAFTTSAAPTIRKGLCYGPLFPPSVCAVYRWNAYLPDKSDTRREITQKEQAPVKLAGRLQCWVDPSLSKIEPNFVLRHPEFDPSLFGWDHIGWMCVADIAHPGSSNALGVQLGRMPDGRPVVMVNNFFVQAQHFGRYDYQLEIGNDRSHPEGPLQVVHKLQGYLFGFLNDYVEKRGLDITNIHDRDVESQSSLPGQSNPITRTSVRLMRQEL